jgi:ribosomal protein S27AE
MKKLKVDYATKMVDSKFFKTVEVVNKEEKDLEPGIIFVPYVFVECGPDEKPSKEYTKFMKKYGKDHKFCPKCGEISHWSTLVGYIYNPEREYKDLNRCTCIKCGDIHTFHERVSKSINPNHI